jgi:putative transposase
VVITLFGSPSTAGIFLWERIELRYKGLMHLKGEQGRLEIHYDPDRKRWYAHISF